MPSPCLPSGREITQRAAIAAQHPLDVCRPRLARRLAQAGLELDRRQNLCQRNGRPGSGLAVDKLLHHVGQALLGDAGDPPGGRRVSTPTQPANHRGGLWPSRPKRGVLRPLENGIGRSRHRHAPRPTLTPPSQAVNEVKLRPMPRVDQAQHCRWKFDGVSWISHLRSLVDHHGNPRLYSAQRGRRLVSLT